jgi:type II secretory ATPase GspE/PulE/Tfp pilus assembly ATPase PilB-like protein
MRINKKNNIFLFIMDFCKNCCIEFKKVKLNINCENSQNFYLNNNVVESLLLDFCPKCRENIYERRKIVNNIIELKEKLKNIRKEERNLKSQITKLEEKEMTLVWEFAQITNIDNDEL